MTDEIYQSLRNRLDQYAHGFAATESGIEIQILRRLFTPQEAEMYLHLTENLQTAEEIARKIRHDPADVEKILMRMTRKGYTFPRFPKQSGEPCYYAAAPWAHGIWEHSARYLDKETARMVLKLQRLGTATRGPAAVRNVPVNATVSDTRCLAPFDDVKAIVKSKSRFAVTDCACYDTHRNAGDSCDQRKEVCMMFDFYADYYVALGTGRSLTREEALSLLEDCKKEGLVHSLPNAENPDFICNCCADCCVVLNAYKRLTKPASVVLSNYITRVDRSSCIGCETCADQCPMDAVAIDEDHLAAIDPDRCIGCGVCVGTCPQEALGLDPKPEAKRHTPPARIPVVRPSKEMERSMYAPSPGPTEI